MALLGAALQRGRELMLLMQRQRVAPDFRASGGVPIEKTGKIMGKHRKKWDIYIYRKKRKIWNNISYKNGKLWDDSWGNSGMTIGVTIGITVEFPRTYQGYSWENHRTTVHGIFLPWQ